MPSVVLQPAPFDPQIPRYAPGHDFPAYRHVPGRTPHPRRDPRGHSYGASFAPGGGALSQHTWRTHLTYLYAVDLFNFAYWWEAHECWEELWRLEPKETPNALFLQGLIQYAVGFVKWFQGSARGVQLLHGHGADKLEQVMRTGGRDPYMGLAMAAFVEQVAGFVARHPVAVPEAFNPLVAPPVIRLVRA